MTAAEVDRSVALLVGTELVVLAGQDSVHNDADDGGHGQTGQADSHSADGEGDGTAGDGAVLDADGQAQDHGSDLYLFFHKKTRGKILQKACLMRRRDWGTSGMFA